jgi:hypothetical protein
MNDLVRHKRPANMPAYRLPTHVETIEGTESALKREIRRLSLAGVLRDVGNWRPVGPPGYFEVRLVLLDRPPRKAPLWARAGVVLGFLMLSAAALATSLTWLLHSLTGGSLLVFLAAVLVAFLGWLKIQYGGGRRVTVTTTTTIDVK